jgi:hypothetical protein
LRVDYSPVARTDPAETGLKKPNPRRNTMAKKPNPKSSYAILDDARVFYDRNNDTVHLTVKDSEIPEGIHLSLNSEREDEKRLRKVLDNHGLLAKSDLMKEYHALQEIAREFNGGAAHMPRDSRYCIPFGFGAETPMSWDIRKDPHLLVTGDPGSGKSIILQNIAEYVLEYGEYDDMELLSAKYSFDPEYSFDENVRNIKKAKAIVEERYRNIVESMARNEEYLPTERVILIVDDFSSIVKSDLESAKMLLGIIRMGMTVGVHVVSTAHGDVSSFSGSREACILVHQIHEAFRATFNMRRFTTSAAFSTAEKALFKILNTGCGMLINSSGKTLVQIIPYKEVMNGKGWVAQPRKKSA